MSTRNNWTSYGLTHVGCVRKHNEDNLLELPEQGLWLVADGMGGMAFGDRASQIVVDAFKDFKCQKTLAENIDDLENRILKANYKCRNDPKVKQLGQIMGSTIVLLFLWKGKAICLWDGDSRLYRLRRGQFEQLSTDHSLVQEMVDFGQINKAEAEFHPQSNIITRGIGVDDDIYVDMEYFSARPGDRFVLCSDGLNKHLMDHEIAIPLNKYPIKRACKALIDMSLKGGGGDNISVILVDIEE